MGFAIPLISGAISILGPIIGDAIGRALGAGDREKAQKLMDDAVRQYGPDILKAPGIAELTPHLGPSQVANTYADAADVAAQREALQELRRASQPDNLEYRAAINQAEADANQQAGAQEGAIRQQMQARGLGGSGVDFALRQAAGSNAANRAAGGAFSAAVEGRRQALDSLKNYGTLATTMRGQGFGEGVQRGQAADRVAELNEAGRVAGQQQAFNNQMGLATARSNVYGNAANVANGQAAQTQAQWGNYGAGVGQGAASIGQAMTDEERRKKGVG